MVRSRSMMAVAAFAASLGFAAAGCAQEGEYEVPYVPTPDTVVAEMLKLANLQKGDVLYDLGSGDGRVVITAAQKYGIRGVGIDINPERISEARENAKKAGVTDRVTFREGDLFQADIHQATVVTMYLLPSVNLRLKPKLLAELKPGTRLISHDFDMGDWKAEKEIKLDHHTIYVWRVPARSAGMK